MDVKGRVASPTRLPPATARRMIGSPAPAPTGSAPMLLGLRTAIYPAPDLERAKHWYREVLGQPPYFDQPFYVGFAVCGFELGLLALGAAALEPVTEVGEGIRVAAVRDPFGNRLGLIQNPHFDVAPVR
jgi:catechol 2,3-dioxygenase-like lactoylglutathione lyase family enzyme